MGNSNIQSDSLKNMLPWLMVGMGTMLMPIWPMMGTIALRNILIFVGGTIGLWYLIHNRSDLRQRAALPLVAIVLMLVWVVIHYFFIGRNPQLEFAQIKSTWLRVVFVSFLGVGTGLFARDNPRARQAVWAGFFLFLPVFLANYVWSSFRIGQWGIPYPDPYNFGVYGLKLGTVFYGMILLGLCCGLIAYRLAQASSHKEKGFLAIVACTLLTFFAFVVADTKNGVALGLILVLTLLSIFVARAKKTFVNISIAAASLAVVMLGAYLHLEHHPEWKKILPTVAMGVQIDTYPNWKDFRVLGLPKLPDGSTVHESVYLRAAFAAAGLKLTVKHPLGYGVVDSFKYLAEEDLPAGMEDRLGGTHSGWIDFALGEGLPGLLLTWAAIVLAMYYSFRQKSRWSHITRWVLAAAFIAWVVAEINSHHFIESLFYLIALLSSGNIAKPQKNQISPKSSAREVLS